MDRLAHAAPTADLEAPPDALAALPPAQAGCLVKLCLAVYNLNEFALID
jgi:hypothetical protein